VRPLPILSVRVLIPEWAGFGAHPGGGDAVSMRRATAAKATAEFQFPKNSDSYWLLLKHQAEILREKCWRKCLLRK